MFSGNYQYYDAHVCRSQQVCMVTNPLIIDAMNNFDGIQIEPVNLQTPSPSELGVESSLTVPSSEPKDEPDVDFILIDQEDLQSHHDTIDNNKPEESNLTG